MYKENAVSPVLCLPRMDGGRRAMSYGAMLMVAVLLHAAAVFLLSRPAHVVSVAPSISSPSPDNFTITDQNLAPAPVDLSYRPEVANVLPPVPGTGQSGPGSGSGVANEGQASVNVSGLVMEGGNGEDVVKIGKPTSLDSLLNMPQAGVPGGNGRPRIGVRARAEQPTVPFYRLEVRPTVVDAPAPVYPEAVRNAGIEGSVAVEALLDLDGSVVDARVLKSSGNDMLDAAAIEAALRARFTPAMQRDKPVRVWISQTYHFKLND